MYTALIVLLMSLVPSLASAQATAQVNACQSPIPVQMSISSEIRTTVSGSSVGYTVQFENEGNELIHDAHLAVQLIPTNKNYAVERFVVPQAIALLPSSDGEVTFTMPIPAGAMSGEYIVLAHLVSQDAKRADMFARTSLPFAAASLTVTGASKAPAVTSLKVNGTERLLGSLQPISTGSAKLEAGVSNDTDVPFIGTLTWNVYAPTAGIGAAPIATLREPVELHPHTTGVAEYTVLDQSLPGYYVSAALSNGVSTSSFDVWLSGDGKVFRELRCKSPGAPASGTSGNRTIIWIVVAVLVLALGAGTARVLKRR